ncbi:MAG TPA: hypothetical protein VHO50_10245 [Bacteroidales bacterium]|nr:hypothetical protein [Bacteroidales bacterium]
MKSIIKILVLVFLIGGCKVEHPVSKFDFTGSKDASLIRGFNYTPAGVKAPRHHTDCWVKYDSAAVEFELDLAKKLDLNQARVFVPYQVYLEDSIALPGKLRHFVRECHKRGIGVMPVLQGGPWVRDTTKRNLGRNWAGFLVNAISSEPGLAMWDIMNEPDYPRIPERIKVNFENCRYMSKVFHELDPNTPVTIGMAFVDGMIELADYVDVLQFHDYMQTSGEIRDTIARAKDFAEKVKKPLINGELGCIARANPYDITLKEHMDAKVGWYIWELMIVREGWGNVHGVFYEDGTVRDPAIAAAIMGFFRKRTGEILPAVTDHEGWVTRIVERSDKWLSDPKATWEEGLYIAETSANLIEAGELTAMRIPPTWEVEMLKMKENDLVAMKAVIKRFRDILDPYKKPVS